MKNLNVGQNIGRIVIAGLLFVIQLSTAQGQEDMKTIKKPNVSGTFYSADPQELSKDIERMMDTAEVAAQDKSVEVLISPHAGYMYSGLVAAHGFKAVARNTYSTIVIIAPSHFVPFEGVSVWPKGSFQTPLGNVDVDEDFVKQLAARNSVIQNIPQAYAREHSLEVQIPFLQKTFSDFKIVPLIMGQPDYQVCQSLAEALVDVIGDRKDILVIASTDLSHYHDDAFAKAMDKKTLQAVVSGQAEQVWNKCLTGEMEMCGFQPVVTALLYAQKKGLKKAELLNYANSADVTGDKSRVVGYSSVIFYKDEASAGGGKTTGVAALTAEQKKRLIEIAKETVDVFVRTGKAPEFKEHDPRLKEVEGAFVTLHSQGQLRGCIGNIIGRKPLFLTVRDMAVAAAAHDPRFTPVAPQELKNIDVEVSVLSKPWTVKSADEIVMGEHGVIVSRGSRSGVYLPQVATDTGWSKEKFLSSLCADKAGLPADAWKDPATKIEVFTAEVFSEKDIE